MSININFNSVSGNGPVGGPSAGEMKDFQKQIQNKSPEELGNMMADKNTAPWKKQEIMKELLNQLQDLLKKEGDQMDPQDKKDLEKLLKDLKNQGVGGENGADNLAKMLEALGIPPEVAQALATAISGGDGGDQGDDSDNNNI